MWTLDMEKRIKLEAIALSYRNFVLHMNFALGIFIVWDGLFRIWLGKPVPLTFPARDISYSTWGSLAMAL